MHAKLTQYVTLIILFITQSGFAQYDTVQVAAIISRLQKLQIKEDTFYNEGLFPTQRTWDGLSVEDNTFSYSATISYVLQRYKQELPENLRDQVVEMVNSANQNAAFYANRKGEASYNFWQTAPPDLPFPNGTKYRKHANRLPDDLDDSSVIALALDDDSLSVAVREKISRYAANNNHKKVPSALKPYQEVEAYRTWFADKWIQDLDVGVMSNILLFTFTNRFPLTRYDSASVEVIIDVIENNHHFQNPEEVSPYYTSTAKILYHLARMMQHDYLGLFEEIKPKVISDLKEAQTQAEYEMERVMIYCALARLVSKPEIDLNVAKLKSELSNFYFFSGFGYLPFPPFKSWLIKEFGLVPNMYWKSESFNLMLIFEFLMETGYTFDESEFPQLLSQDI